MNNRNLGLSSTGKAQGIVMREAWAIGVMLRLYGQQCRVCALAGSSTVASAATFVLRLNCVHSQQRVGAEFAHSHRRVEPRARRVGASESRWVSCMRELERASASSGQRVGARVMHELYRGRSGCVQ